MAERFVGTVRGELLDHIVVLDERHLRRLLQEYVAYYDADRVHSSIGDAPEGRSPETRPDGPATVTTPSASADSTIDPLGARLPGHRMNPENRHATDRRLIRSP
jgi:hypothetical protein